MQAAVKLLDWGVNTGLDTDEIGTAASAWLTAKNDDRTECLQKLELVDEAYQKLLTDEARELLDSAGCAEVEITWGSEPVEPVEAIMRSAGLRDADSGDDAAWDVAGFEKSLLENYGVTPYHYEDLGDGVYQVYVEIEKLLDKIIARKKLHEYGMTEDQIQSFAEGVEQNQQRLLNQSYVKFNVEQMVKIYRQLF